MTVQMRNVVRSIAALALLSQCTVAGASMIVMTTPEVENFSLTPDPVTFEVVNVNEGEDPLDVMITNSNDGPKTANQILTFDKFDTSLGALLGVTISFTSLYELGPAISVSFPSSSTDPEEIVYFADGALTLSLTGTGLISSQSSNPAAGASCKTTDAACSSVDLPTTASFDGSTPGLGPLTTFEGPGTFDLVVSISSALAPRIDPDNGTGFSDNATMDGTLDSAWNGDVSVVYEYRVPEPLALYLLAGGLGVFALSRRRRG